MTVEHRTRLIDPLFLFPFLAVGLCLAVPAHSASFMDEVFVVETSEEDASESLNRVAGNIDRGFSSEEDSYRSEHHGKAGPFATQEESYDVHRTAY